MSSTATTTAIAQNKRTKRENEELRRQVKRHKTSFAAVAQEYTCPITKDLLVDPVTAEDGFQYEREAMEKTIEVQGDRLRSPKTNQPMGPRLLEAVTVRNTIELLVTGGAVDGEAAQSYKQRKKVVDVTRQARAGHVASMRKLADWYRWGRNGVDRDDDKYREWKQKAKDGADYQREKEAADGGDVEAMYNLGLWYEEGRAGLPKDDALAFQWYKKSSDKKYPPATAAAGEYVANGWGGTEGNEARGVSMVALAAERGSDFACYLLGMWNFAGDQGLDEDDEEAKYWLEKAIGGDCEFKTLTATSGEHVRELLKDIDEEQSYGNGSIDSSNDDEGGSDEDEAEQDILDVVQQTIDEVLGELHASSRVSI